LLQVNNFSCFNIQNKKASLKEAFQFVIIVEAFEAGIAWPNYKMLLPFI
tara:strand:+ start:731 stop:877 length:147 start_codon:yes stop_codon:yes gene_type:complete